MWWLVERHLRGEGGKVIAVGGVGGVNLKGLGANVVIDYREEVVRKGDNGEVFAELYCA